MFNVVFKSRIMPFTWIENAFKIFYVWFLNTYFLPVKGIYIHEKKKIRKISIIESAIVSTHAVKIWDHSKLFINKIMSFFSETFV